MYSPKTYKVCSKLCFVLFIVCMIIGIPTFPFGGFIFILIGLFFYVLSRSCKKASLDQPANNTITSETNKSDLFVDYVYINKSSKCYHWNVQCRSVGTNFKRITREEARRKGLKPCKNCDTY